MANETATLVVGYALRPKRVESFVSPDLISHGSSNGVKFLQVDPKLPLIEQGPFDLLLHKLDGDSWSSNLADYQSKYPQTVIIDEYDAVHKLDDRRGMLQVVQELDKSVLEGVRVEVPGQIIIEMGTSPSDIAKILKEQSFNLPAVAKPLEANGTTSSHSLALVLNDKALEKLEPPVLLQEFVNHGGILFKLYVLGDKVMVFRRQSLPDIPPPGEGAGEEQANNLVEFNRISNVHLTEEQLQDSRVTDPPPSFMRALGLSLRDLMHLQAFNVDILREGGHGDRYFIVDINYMPGYERIPNFPEFFVDFVKKCVSAKNDAGNKVAKGVNELPEVPYPVLAGKKKWVYFRAAMKLCGLHQRVGSGGGDEKVNDGL